MIVKKQKSMRETHPHIKQKNQRNEYREESFELNFGNFPFEWLRFSNMGTDF